MANNLIPSDNSGIFVGLNNSAQGRAVISPSTLPVGVAGFVFDIEGEETFELRSEISDHYVERNTTIQDQWGRLPERVTLKGYVGELVGYFQQPANVKNVGLKTLPLHAGLVPQILAGFGLPGSLTPTVVSFVGQIASNYNVPPTVTAQIAAFISDTPPSAATTAAGFINSITASSNLPTSITDQITAYTTAAVNGIPANVIGSDNVFSPQVVANLPSGWKQAATSFAGQFIGQTLGKALSPVSNNANSLAAIEANALGQYTQIGLDADTSQASAASASSSLYGYYLANGAGASGASKQAQAFGFFYQLWLSAQTCSIQTPWGTMDNMAIENLKVTQIEESQYISDFSITFKKIRYVNTFSASPLELAGRSYALVTQTNPVNNGNAGLISSSNLLFSLPTHN